MPRWMIIALLAATMPVPLSTAQMRGGMGRQGSAGHANFGRGIQGGVRSHRHRRPFTSGIFWDSPLVDSDDLNEQSVNEQNLDESSRLQILRPASVEDSSRRTRTAPLLIEWRGDRYVRFGGTEETAQRGASAHPDYSESTQAKSAVSSPPQSRAQAETQPAVLVYRDGHREDIHDYVIADGVVYARDSSWQNGYRTRQLPLSALDPSATMQANQERGIKFMLPSASDVVIASF